MFEKALCYVFYFLTHNWEGSYFDKDRKTLSIYILLTKKHFRASFKRPYITTQLNFGIV